LGEYHLDRLDFPALLSVMARGTYSPRGRRLLEELRPAADLEEVHERQEVQAEVTRHAVGESRIPLADLPDVDDLLSRLKKPGAELEGERLWDLRMVVRTVDEVGAFLKDRAPDAFPVFSRRFGAVGRYADELGRLDAALEPGGVVRDGATPELARLRKLLKRQEGRLRQLAHDIATRWYAEGIAQEPEPVLRDGRHVIAVRSEGRSRANGFAVDRSRTGQTLFIEPQELSEAALELKDTRRQEEQEVERILAELSGMCAIRSHDLDDDLDRLAVLDVGQAASRYADAGPLHIPTVEEGCPLDLARARHPLLAASHGVDKVVPLTLTLGTSERTLVISGPNSGGKTVALQTTGLCTAMALAGLPIPADEGSRIPFVDSILADIGDEQSLQADLSTFTAHLKRLRTMIEGREQRKLCLIDEAGSGTDPAQGAALATSILERLTAEQAYVLCTTHNGRVKDHAAAADGMANGRMVFSRESLTPTYEFQHGEPGRSFAFEIAARAGFPGEVVERAKTLLDPVENRLEALQQEAEAARERLDGLEQDAISDRKTAARERREYERLRAELDAESDQLRRKAASEAEELVADARRRIEQVIRDIRETQAERASIRSAHQVVEELQQGVAEQKPPAEPAGMPGIGGEVYVIPLDRNAVIESIAGRRIRVRSDGLSIEVAPEDLKPATAPQRDAVGGTRPRRSPAGGVRVPLKQVSDRIELIGCRVEEARALLEKFLDDAILAGLEHASVIHGVGTGALRNAVAEVLAEHPSVEGFDLDRETPGGHGVTLVQLRGAAP
jgi:DNA mismatch repair protein MutS2